MFAGCRESPEPAPLSVNKKNAQDTVTLHPLILSTNAQAKHFKNTDWKKWCSLYDSAYASLFDVERDPKKLFKQPLLDSIIEYKHFYKDDSTTGLLRNAYYNRAYDFDDLGKYYRAKDDFESTLSLAERIGFKSFQQESQTLNQLSSIYNRLGDITQSILLRKRQIERCKKDGTIEQLIPAYINFAILYDDIGETDTAITLLREALSFDSLSLWSKAKLYTKIASFEANNNPDEAEKNAGHALSLLSLVEELQAPDFIAEAYEALARIKMHQHAPEAETLYKTLVRKKIAYEGTERKREIGKAYLSLAEFYKFNNDPQKEILTIQRSLYTVTDVDSTNIFSLPSKQTVYPENTIMEALDAKAEWMMHHANGNEKLKYFTHAAACFELAFEAERKLMQHFSYDQSKLMQLQESRRRSEKAIKCCYDLFLQTKKISWINKAWQFAENSKAIVLLHSIRKNIAASGLLADELYVKMERLQAQVTAKEKEIYELSIEHKRNDTLQKQKDALEQQLLNARITLRQQNSSYKYLSEAADSLDLQLADKKLLDDKTALIEYFVGDSAAYAFTLFKERQPSIQLLSGSLNAQADSFLYFFSDKRLINTNPLTWQRISHRLYLTLIAPAIKIEKINSLIIIPDEQLNILPFDALLTQPAQGLNLKNLPYLVKDIETTVGYSVTALLKQPGGDLNKKDIAGFAPVEFKNKFLPDLPFTANEIENLRGRYKHGKYFLKDAATLANFRLQAARASVLHIASHANGNLEGAKSAIRFADSTLYLDELYSLHIPASIVVLSTCESGTGKIEKGEGAMSLARGFYYAGAGAVINSLWKVNDQSTARLFNTFYKRLHERSYSSALHAAKLAYLNETPSDECSPFYWAGFVFTGNSRQKSTGNSYIWLTAAGILAIGVLWFVKRNRLTYSSSA